MTTTPFDGRVWQHALAFIRYELHGEHKPHVDVDFEGRCLSASIALASGDGDDGTEGPGGREGNYSCGVFTLRGCLAQTLEESIAKSACDDSDWPSVRLPGRAGSLAVFLAENVHEVSPVTRGTRSMVFLWLTCIERDALDSVFKFDARKYRTRV